jgi:hypothetical protein
MLKEVIQIMIRAISALYKQVSFSAAMTTHYDLTFVICYVIAPKEAWSKHTVRYKLTAYTRDGIQNILDWCRHLYRHCATNRKVAGSILSGVIKIVH